MDLYEKPPPKSVEQPERGTVVAVDDDPLGELVSVIRIMVVPFTGGTGTCLKVVIKVAARADLHHLGLFLQGTQTDAPQQGLQVLHIVVRELSTTRLELEKEHKKSTSMDSQGQTTSLQRLQNVEKRIVKVLELVGGVMDELASPVGPRKDVVQNHCLEFMQLIKDASDSWGLSVSFLSIILLLIVGNAAEHAGAIDISLAVALGSATQIAMFVVPLCVIIAWIIPINMDLNFNLLETGSLALAIIVTGFTLQDGTSHYMKGVVLLLCYIVIGACFFVQRTPFNNQADVTNITLKPATNAVLSA
ncbi:hypothetical protein JHK82_025306 [Glycine max]|nr:hypothetical protein JHK82_025306 [Glycine max]